MTLIFHTHNQYGILLDHCRFYEVYKNLQMGSPICTCTSKDDVASCLNVGSHKAAFSCGCLRFQEVASESLSHANCCAAYCECVLHNPVLGLGQTLKSLYKCMHTIGLHVFYGGY